MDDAALHLLGLARKGGRIEVGEEPTGAACRARKAKVVLLARDGAEHTQRRAEHFARAGNTLQVMTPYTKAQLGSALGRSSCAMAAITDAGLAASFLAKLMQLDPEQYRGAYEALDAKAKKVLQRQREQRQHEKNLANPRRKPPSPPKGGGNTGRSKQ